MINGAHVIIYSKDAVADRAFLREIFKLPNLDIGQGWFVFGLPPSEVVVHASEVNDVHELYFMCDNVKKLVTALKAKKVKCAPIDEQRWGKRTWITLPGGGKLVVYQPKHSRAPRMKSQLSRLANLRGRH